MGTNYLIIPVFLIYQILYLSFCTFRKNKDNPRNTSDFQILPLNAPMAEKK